MVPSSVEPSSEAGAKKDGSEASSQASRLEPVRLADAGVCVFSIDGKEFALDTALVGEVVTVDSILPVPLSPPAVLGLFSLRGMPVAVIDLLAALGQPSEAKPLKGYTLLVLRTQQTLGALRIDRLNAVVPAGRGRRALSDTSHDHPAAIGFFEPGPNRPAAVLLGSKPLIDALLKLSFSNENRRETA